MNKLRNKRRKEKGKREISGVCAHDNEREGEEGEKKQEEEGQRSALISQP